MTPSKLTKTILERAFFGKETCLIVSLNAKNECYFQFGKKFGKDASGKDAWTWKKVKMNDMELGDILQVLERRREKVSFFHSFKGTGKETQTQIWVERLPGKDGGNVSFRVKEATRALYPGEQEVLAVLLRHAIVLMNLQL